MNSLAFKLTTSGPNIPPILCSGQIQPLKFTLQCVILKINNHVREGQSRINTKGLKVTIFTFLLLRDHPRLYCFNIHCLLCLHWSEFIVSPHVSMQNYISVRSDMSLQNVRNDQQCLWDCKPFTHTHTRLSLKCLLL